MPSVALTCKQCGKLHFKLYSKFINRKKDTYVLTCDHCDHDSVFRIPQPKKRKKDK